MKKYPTFQLANTELALAAKFLEGHEAMHGPGEVRDGPRYVFRVVNCGIGSGTLLMCATCKDEVDITDYGIW